jgi:hypothetical protein
MAEHRSPKTILHFRSNVGAILVIAPLPRVQDFSPNEVKDSLPSADGEY